MNSNIELMSAALLVAVLALAGCGGGGSGDTTPDLVPMPTPEEGCRSDGGIYEGGECRSADDLREEGAAEEGQKRDAEAATAKRMADAEKYHGLLTATTPATVAQPENDRISTYADQIGEAEDGVYNQDMIEIMIRNTPDGGDAEYGWWLDETADLTGSARVGAWYADNAGTAIELTGGVENSSGTASYVGHAIGVAAYYHSLGGDANVGGAFTADAELSADFDTNMLSGSITNFDIGGFSPAWSVALGSSAITAGTGAVANAGTTTWTIGETAVTARADAAGGGWTAQFYNIPSGAHQPTGVAGGFKAQFESDGYMVGAFGAKQP